MPRASRLISATASVAASALILGAFGIIGAPDGRVREAPPPKVMTLAALRGAETADGGAAARDTAPPPEQLPTQPSSPPLIPQPMAVIPEPPVMLPSVFAQAPPIPRSAPPPILSQASPAALPMVLAVTRTTGATAAAVPAAPAPRGIAEVLDAKAPAGASLSYAARVRSWLLAHKLYPKRARMRRQEGIALIRFVLDRQGRVLQHRLERSSGHAALDEEVLAMLDRATPFPTAPRDVTGNTLEFVAPIAFLLASDG